MLQLFKKFPGNLWNLKISFVLHKGLPLEEKRTAQLGKNSLPFLEPEGS